MQKKSPNIQSFSIISATVNGILNVVIIKSEMANIPISTLVELAQNRRCRNNVRHTRQLPANDTMINIEKQATINTSDILRTNAFLIYLFVLLLLNSVERKAKSN